MTWLTDRIVLGSRSPQRRELLRQLLPDVQIEICPPESAAEAGFEGLERWADIEDRLRDIARTKWDAVRSQWALRNPAASEESVRIITADTVIVAPQPDSSDRLIVLGQPPDDAWQNTVRNWFHQHLFGRTHWAATAVCVGPAVQIPPVESLVRTAVTFLPRDEELLEWYLSTGEPRGKAGGYAIQGAGSVFVAQVIGSLSNVVGLPLRELRTMLQGSEGSQ